MPNIFIYSPKPNATAKALAEALDAQRLKNFDGLHFWSKGKVVDPPADSIIVNWGGKLPEFDDIRVLNPSTTHVGKYAEYQAWRNQGISMPAMWHGRTLANGLGKGWFPRRAFHTPLEDLINPPTAPSFWANQLDLVKEYKLHIFNNRTIKSGEKVLREGFTLATSHAEWLREADSETTLLAHPWWRHFNTGWTVNYVDYTATPAMRKLALAAVKALELNFGTVDIGVGKEGDLFVVGFNRTPHLDTATLPRYIKLIQRWIDVAPAEPDEAEPEVPLPTAPPMAGNYYAHIDAPELVINQEPVINQQQLNNYRRFFAPRAGR